MKRYPTYIIGTCIVALLILFHFFGHFLDPFDTIRQRDAAKTYMDSLTDKDIQAWIQRAQKDLKDYPLTNFGLDVPPDLQKLGITGIEEWDTNSVEYVWLGGMDNTRLVVERTTDGNFQVTAIYTPYSNRVIWPRQ